MAENPTPEASETANPSPEPVANTGTVQPSGDANGQGAPAEEMFGNVDPKTLPPQLKAVYDNMLKGFKEKTTKLSETTKAEVAKATEVFKQKAEFYDQFTKQEKAVKFWNEYVQEVNGQGQEVDKNGDPVVAELKSKVEAFERKQMETELGSVIDAFAEAVDEKGQPVAPHFEKLNSMVIGQTQGANGQPEEFSLLRATTQLAPGNTPQEKLANGYKMAEKLYSAILEEGKKMGMGRVQTKVLNGSLPPSGATAPGTVTMVDKKPKNAAEALAMARKGQLVSR